MNQLSLLAPPRGQFDLFRKRGTPIALIIQKAFDLEGNRRPGSFTFETVTPTAPPDMPRSSWPVESNKKNVRKKRAKPPRPEEQHVPLDKLRWLTIRQASFRYPAFSEKAIRHLVAQAEAYATAPKSGLRSNGFLPCIIRPANQRKILIDANRFEEWLAAFSKGQKS